MEKPFKQRKAEATRMITRYPGRIPIIVQRDKRSSSRHLPDIDKKKYLVPADFTVGQFMFVIRKRIHLEGHIALFLYTEDGQMLTTSSLLSSAYDVHKNEDAFFYIFYTSENTFGKNIF